MLTPSKFAFVSIICLAVVKSSTVISKWIGRWIEISCWCHGSICISESFGSWTGSSWQSSVLRKFWSCCFPLDRENFTTKSTKYSRKREIRFRFSKQNSTQRLFKSKLVSLTGNQAICWKYWPWSTWTINYNSRSTKSCEYFKIYAFWQWWGIQEQREA